MKARSMFLTEEYGHGQRERPAIINDAKAHAKRELPQPAQIGLEMAIPTEEIDGHSGHGIGLAPHWQIPDGAGIDSK